MPQRKIWWTFKSGEKNGSFNTTIAVVSLTEKKNNQRNVLIVCSIYLFTLKNDWYFPNCPYMAEQRWCVLWCNVRNETNGFFSVEYFRCSYYYYEREIYFNLMLPSIAPASAHCLYMRNIFSTLNWMYERCYSSSFFDDDGDNCSFRWKLISNGFGVQCKLQAK